MRKDEHEEAWLVLFLAGIFGPTLPSLLQDWVPGSPPAVLSCLEQGTPNPAPLIPEGSPPPPRSRLAVLETQLPPLDSLP